MTAQALVVDSYRACFRRFMLQILATVRDYKNSAMMLDNRLVIAGGMVLSFLAGFLMTQAVFKILLDGF